jgi:hypothetical protein
MDEVEPIVADGHDRRAVDRVETRDPDERTVARAGHRAGLEPGERESVRPRLSDTGGAEVRRVLEVDHRLSEPILLRGGATRAARSVRSRGS